MTTLPTKIVAFFWGPRVTFRLNFVKIGQAVYVEILLTNKQTNKQTFMKTKPPWRRWLLIYLISTVLWGIFIFPDKFLFFFLSPIFPNQWNSRIFFLQFSPTYKNCTHICAEHRPKVYCLCCGTVTMSRYVVRQQSTKSLDISTYMMIAEADTEWLTDGKHPANIQLTTDKQPANNQQTTSKHPANNRQTTS